MAGSVMVGAARCKFHRVSQSVFPVEWVKKAKTTLLETELAVTLCGVGTVGDLASPAAWKQCSSCHSSARAMRKAGPPGTIYSGSPSEVKLKLCSLDLYLERAPLSCCCWRSHGHRTPFPPGEHKP